ncbi:hypothetical protein RIF29_33080 [Crotalaria pallida]|uniref:BHLH domain-containing protein n=1 Tax=Crotalaria pallida TaxID=3830 RepID=A0AAN9HQH5_CROPI
MSALRVVEWLRPLVQTNTWDFVVVWKYGTDPTRYIEWMGCCCSGSCSHKIEMDDHQCHLDSTCRDTHFQHPIRTKACQALAKLPFSMSLFSGVHGEIAVSQQPKWLTQEIPKDISIIDYISTHCCVSLKQEAISAVGYASLNFDEHKQCLQRWPTLSTLTSNVQLPGSKCSSHPSFEGTSSGSYPPNEHKSCDSKTQHEYVKNKSPMPKIKKPKYNGTSGKQRRVLKSHCGNGEEEKSKLVRQPQGERFIAKNLATERKRRNRIKNGLFTLRSLVPKITKMDRVSILSDAIDYIKELKSDVKELKDVVMALEVEDCERNLPELKMSTSREQGGTISVPLSELNQSSSDSNKKKHMKVQAEVYHVGRTDFLIKLYCEQKQGGFSRLMEAIHSVGLQVTNANMTTHDGKVMNILTVKATKQDINPVTLKEYLIEQAVQ